MPRSTFTPGPWSITGSDEHGRYIVNADDDQVMYDVCLVADYADAELIIAVPDLLEAAKDALICIRDATRELALVDPMHPFDYAESIEAELVAAIQKAEGVS